MDEVLLERFAYSPHGVFGRITLPEFECFTVERPWLDNEAEKSCIPEGTYDLELGTYHRGGYPAYEVMDVPNRSLIKIHIGNTIDDVVGCIALGKSLGYLKNKWAVSTSRQVFTEFMAVMEDFQATKINIHRYTP